MSHWDIRDYLYGRTIHLFRGPIAQAQEFFTKNGSDWNLKKFTDCNGVSLFDMTVTVPLVAIWLPPTFDSTSIRNQATLAHECLHITHYVLEYAGMQLTESSSEAFTYYMGWLYVECMERLKSRSRGRKRKCNQARRKSSSTAQSSNDGQSSKVENSAP